MKKVVIFLDEFAGLRAWGLVLYGALPATLALLGTVEIKLDKIDPTKILYIIAATPIPIVILFLTY